MTLNYILKWLIGTPPVTAEPVSVASVLSLQVQPVSGLYFPLRA